MIAFGWSAVDVALDIRDGFCYDDGGNAAEDKHCCGKNKVNDDIDQRREISPFSGEVDYVDDVPNDGDD